MLKTQLQSEDFFVIRTPRVSLTQLSDTPDSNKKIREYLQNWLEKPGVKEALYIATPALIDGIEVWKKKPDSKQGRKCEQSLIKYMIRMCSRPTPFGLFSGIHLGNITSDTKLISENLDKDSRKTRLDMLYLTKLKEYAVKQSNSSLKYIPNSSHYYVANECRYIESYQSDDRYHYCLSAIESNEYLEMVLASAENGATISELSQQFVEKYPEAKLEEIAAYIEELVAESLLVPVAPLPLTGQSPDISLTKALMNIGHSELADSIGTVISRLNEINNNSDGNIDEYKQVFAHLKGLPVKVQESRLFQTDVYKSFRQCSVDQSFVHSLLQNLAILKALGPQHKNPFQEFIQKFNARYEGQFVRLDKLLDDESGIGFSNETGYEAPLIAGLKLERAKTSTPQTSTNSILEHEITRILSLPCNIGKTEIKLSAKELSQKANIKNIDAELPASFATMFSLYKDKQEKLILGFQGTYGPSAANLLGRFSHLNNEIEVKIKQHLEKEEELSPDVIFAEIAHMPEGRIGNVIARPHLRKYEIVFMADSSLPKENQIYINDLYVWIETGHVKLWSKRLNKQIIPRLSSAHNFGSRSLSIYKFLSLLQNQRVQAPSLYLPHSLSSAGFVPRIMMDNLVLSPKTWRIPRKELEELKCEKEVDLNKLSTLKDKYQLDDWLTYSMGDNVLQIKLDNPLMFEVLLAETKEQMTVELKEVLATNFTSAVASNSGEYFSNEVILPVFNPNAKPYQTFTAPPDLNVSAEPIKRRFAPGSEWLSIKIYSGNSSVEGVLVEQLASLIEQNHGLYKKWFFIRYGDPDWHIRLRFQGEPKTMYSELLPILNNVFAPAIEEGLIHKIELFTYEREVERYGGSSSIELCESLFMQDSILTTKALSYLDEFGEDIRWRIVMLSTDRLLDAFNYTSEGKLNLIDSLRTGFGREFNDNSQLRKQLGTKFKSVNPTLRNDMEISKQIKPVTSDDQILLFSLIESWHRSVLPYVSKLNELIEENKLVCSKDSLLGSILHMHNNRMFKTHGREHELVMHDYLRRYYFSAQKRKGKG